MQKLFITVDDSDMFISISTVKNYLPLTLSSSLYGIIYMLILY